MAILSLTAKLGLDGRGFRQGLKEAEKLAGNLKHQLAAAFSVGAAIAFAKNIAKAVGEIKDMADQYGITTDEVQKATVALKQNGLQFEQLGQSIQKIGQARRDAVEGNMELRETFERYGLTLKDLNNPQLRNYDLILRITDAIKGQNITAREQVELTDLLGARSFKLISTLQTLKDFEGIELFTPHDIELIDQASKSVDELHRKLQVLAAAGAVEARRNPLQFLGDYLRGLPGIGPTASLNALGKVIEGLSPKPGAPPLTPEDVISANVEKKLRLAAPPEGPLFEVDKNLKEKRQLRAGSIDRFDVPTPGGFGAFGGHSAGFIAGFDPKVIVARDQLSELQKLNVKADKIVANTSANGNVNGAFRP